MNQEPLRVPPKLQPGEMDAVTEALYRSDDPPTVIRDEPIVPNPALVAAAQQRRRFKEPAPKRRERLLDRRDWQTIAIIAGIVGGFTFLCAFFGIVLGAAF